MRTCDGSIGARGVPVTSAELAQAASSRQESRIGRMRMAGLFAAFAVTDSMPAMLRRRRAPRDEGRSACSASDPGPVHRLLQPALDVPGVGAEPHLHVVAAGGQV